MHIRWWLTFKKNWWDGSLFKIYCPLKYCMIHYGTIGSIGWILFFRWFHHWQVIPKLGNKIRNKIPVYVPNIFRNKNLLGSPCPTQMKKKGEKKPSRGIKKALPCNICQTCIYQPYIKYAPLENNWICFAVNHVLILLLKSS
jgi:hypothetical protein